MYTDDHVTILQSLRLATSALDSRPTRASRLRPLASARRTWLALEVRVLTGALARARHAEARARLV
ncbi:hypothetical protein [Demequina subtropica]|uniref:hypothetical protein n=1 Tax=Demequina subtropica TaxID=1638989 RepID=UPI0007845BF0|nr:hypothetical protein [Demequina subtropica]